MQSTRIKPWTYFRHRLPRRFDAGFESFDIAEQRPSRLFSRWPNLDTRSNHLRSLALPYSLANTDANQAGWQEATFWQPSAGRICTNGFEAKRRTTVISSLGVHARCGTSRNTNWKGIATFR